MNQDEQLADQAEEELEDLKAACVASSYSEESRQNLWKKFQEWIDRPEFCGQCGRLRCTVLNQLHFTIGDQALWEELWELLTKLAARWHREGKEDLKEALRIASFECIAEPPADPKNLKRLFSLAENPETLWVVWGAYENVPWRLRPHAHAYSNGLVTDEVCDDWLAEDHWDDEILMSVPRSLPWKRNG